MGREDSYRRESISGILICFFFSGAAGLIYQVAWSKALGLISGHTAYAIATVLAVFMAGLASGSSFFGRWRKTQAELISLYSWIEFLAGATGALPLAGLGGVRFLYTAAYPHMSSVPALLLGLRFFGAAAVLFIPTFLMGGTLPILVQGVTKHRVELGSRASQLYWVNTLGALAGTLISGFVPQDLPIRQKRSGCGSPLGHAPPAARKLRVSHRCSLSSAPLVPARKTSSADPSTTFSARPRIMSLL